MVWAPRHPRSTDEFTGRSHPVNRSDSAGFRAVHTLFTVGTPTDFRGAALPAPTPERPAIRALPPSSCRLPDSPRLLRDFCLPTGRVGGAAASPLRPSGGGGQGEVGHARLFSARTNSPDARVTLHVARAPGESHLSHLSRQIPPQKKSPIPWTGQIGREAEDGGRRGDAGGRDSPRFSPRPRPALGPPVEEQPAYLTYPT